MTTSSNWPARSRTVRTVCPVEFTVCDTALRPEAARSSNCPFLDRGPGDSPTVPTVLLATPPTFAGIVDGESNFVTSLRVVVGVCRVRSMMARTLSSLTTRVAVACTPLMPILTWSMLASAPAVRF